MENSCSYCGFSYCSSHRLPENHNCSALSDLNTLGPDFRGEINFSESASNEPSASEITEKAECNRCSNYTTSDHELCLECRRKEQTISSRSPDLSADGSVESKDNSEKTDTGTSSSESILSKLKSILGR
ncbi:AN1-type zinc finger domain-containing protein [Natrinema hispanicum]|uniref:AN1-type zinc finger domain-containing protein n=1 Tax=Natrinema hispanicum TaxID=392421 RepID=UPI00102BBAE6